ncbi:YcnI family copper-binding membrane protein [Streptomyces sp. NPDC054887]
MNIIRTSAVSVVAAAASAVLLCAGTAFAHVSVQPVGPAEKGGYATVNVRVPNERDNASTVKLEVSFPTDHPLSSVMPQPVPGWKADVVKTKLDKPLKVHGEEIDEAVSKITWTGGKVGPGEFQQFPLALGPLPEDTDRLVLKAVQTYDNDEVVRWIEEPKKGQEEPQAPAPVLELSEPAGDDHHGASGDKSETDAEDDGEKAAGTDGAGHGSKTAAARGESSDASGVSGSDTTARVLAVVGIAVGAAGVAFGVLAGRRRTS